MRNSKNRALMIIVILLLAACIGGLIWLATPYNSRLAWKVDEWLHSRRITYTHNNIYTDGVQGILDDIETKVDLPETLYIRNVQNIDYQANGTVTGIEMFLYGTKDNGKNGTWLVSYSAASEEEGDTPTLTVWIGDTLSDDITQNGFKDSMLLAPMIELSSTLDLAQRSQLYVNTYECGTLQMLYWGYRSMDLNLTSYVVTEDGALVNAQNYGILNEPNTTYEGYEISIHDANGECDPARYFAGWLTSADYVNPETAAMEQHENEMDAHRIDEGIQGTGYLDSSDGTMYCYVSNEIGYRLVVADAAAGSRFYHLEMTTDGGATWALQNEDPFLGLIGVVGGMQFEDEMHGRIWLDSPSGGTKETCITEDGCVTFTAVDETSAAQ